MPKKKWSDLTPHQKRAVYIGGAVEAVITAAALRDLARRPADQVCSKDFSNSSRCLPKIAD